MNASSLLGSVNDLVTGVKEQDWDDVLTSGAAAYDALFNTPVATAPIQSQAGSTAAQQTNAAVSQAAQQQGKLGDGLGLLVALVGVIVLVKVL